MKKIYPIVRDVKNEIALPIMVSCTVEGKYMQSINCEYWTGDPEKCNGICKINAKENPSFEDCVTCDKRKSFAGKKKIIQKNAESRAQVVDVLDVFVGEPSPPLPESTKKLQPLKETEKKRLPKNFEKIEQLNKDIKEKSFTKKAKDYLKAESSQAAQGKVSKKVFEYRKDICMKCEFRVEKTPSGKADSIGWCKGGCGCTVGNPRAALSQKLYMPTLSCPKNKFGPAKGEGFNIEDALDSAKSVIKSVFNVFTEKKNT